MKNKKIIEILKKTNEKEVKFNPNYNKLALSLNITQEEKLNNNLETKFSKYNVLLVKRVILYTSIFIIGFFSCFSILIYGFKYNKPSENPYKPDENYYIQNDVLIKEIFNNNNCNYLQNSIYSFVDNEIIGYVYLGVNKNGNVFFVFEFINNLDNMNIIIESNDGVNLYQANSRTSQYSHYLLMETSNNYLYYFKVSYNVESKDETLEFTLNVRDFINYIK
jgi:hypothetical protein